MKNLKVFAIAMALCLSLATVVFAVGKLAGKASAQTTASCCADANCCSGGACKMNGSCCDSHKSTAQKADFKGVPVEDEGKSCNKNKGQVANGTKDCCDDGNAACCNGGSCCKSKTKTVAKL